MRHLKSILQPCFIACTLTVVFFSLFAPPLHAWAAAGGEGILRQPNTPETPPELPTPADLLTVKFGPIKPMTTIADVPTPADLAQALAEALDIPRDEIKAAELMCDRPAGPCTDPQGAAVLGPVLGTWFPTRGPSFALLATSVATESLQASARQAAGTLSDTVQTAIDTLQGITNGDGGDVMRFHLRLQAPPPPVASRSTLFSIRWIFPTIYRGASCTRAPATPLPSTSTTPGSIQPITSRTTAPARQLPSRP